MSVSAKTQPTTQQYILAALQYNTWMTTDMILQVLGEGHTRSMVRYHLRNLEDQQKVISITEGSGGIKRYKRRQPGGKHEGNHNL